MGVPGTPPEIPPCPPDNEGNRFSLLPGAQEACFAPGNRFSSPPGALRPFSAPGKRFSLLPGAQEACFAPGNRFSSPPGSLRRQGRCGPSPPLANGFLCCQGRWCPSLPPALRNRRAAQARAHRRDSLSVDQVHFEDLYQVHRPCLRSPSEPLWVYLVHPLKSHHVHLTMKATGFPCCQGRRRPVSPPAIGFLRRQGRCDPSPPLASGFLCSQGRRRPVSPPATGFLRRQGRHDPSSPSGRNSGGTSGRIRPLYGPMGEWQRGFGLENALIQAKG